VFDSDLHRSFVTTAGLEALRKRTSVVLTKQIEIAEKSPRIKPGAIECDEVLFARLRALRRQLADERGVPAYIIFSDVSLREMAKHYPTTSVQFRRIPGVGEQKLKQFAEPFLDKIKGHLRVQAGTYFLNVRHQGLDSFLLLREPGRRLECALRNSLSSAAGWNHGAGLLTYKSGHAI
jgi:hypothetical protein